jgi:PAS domain S-box-containing protein
LIVVVIIFLISIRQNYLLFHTLIELFSIVVAFAVFIVTWNGRKMLDNNYLSFVGIAYLFIAALDLLHTMTFPGMHIIPGDRYYANQFWVATRFLGAVTLIIGFFFLQRKKMLNVDKTIFAYFTTTSLIILSILDWHIFPVCYVEGLGQTDFKIFAEYIIIGLLIFAGFLLFKVKNRFEPRVYHLLAFSVFFAILSEFCFTLYISNYSMANEFGHYAKLMSFFLIYKAIVETGFTRPAGLLFKDLKDNEEKYRTLAENLPELIFRFDQDFVCLYANKAVEKVLPQSHTLLIGKNLLEIGFPENFEMQLGQTLLKVKETDTAQQISFNVSECPNSYSFSVDAIPERGSVHSAGTYLVICYDITNLKITEKRLQDLNATKDKFFSIIAHDLRNPFTSLIAFSELIYKNANKLSTEKIENLAVRMNDSAKQAFTLLENLLNWSRVQTGALIPNPQVLAARDLLMDIKDLSGSLALSKGIAIELADSEIIGQVQADRQMINTVLRNLVANAIKFSYPNAQIVLDAKPQENGYIHFSVTDYGTGIEKENQEQLLKLDNKLSIAGTHQEKGTGLGLVLCKEFVELSGGKIWLESDFGMGTTFFFSLPEFTD